MIPGSLNLTGDNAIYTGDDYTLTTRIGFKANDGSKTYMDLTGYTGKADIRSAAGSPTLIASITVTVAADQSLTGGTRGVVTLTIPNATTAGIPVTVTPSLYKWDLQLTDTNGKKRTYLAGDVEVVADVTKP